MLKLAVHRKHAVKSQSVLGANNSVCATDHPSYVRYYWQCVVDPVRMLKGHIRHALGSDSYRVDFDQFDRQGNRFHQHLWVGRLEQVLRSFDEAFRQTHLGRKQVGFQRWSWKGCGLFLEVRRSVRGRLNYVFQIGGVGLETLGPNRQMVRRMVGRRWDSRDEEIGEGQYDRLSWWVIQGH